MDCLHKEWWRFGYGNLFYFFHSNTTTNTPTYNTIDTIQMITELHQIRSIDLRIATRLWIAKYLKWSETTELIESEETSERRKIKKWIEQWIIVRFSRFQTLSHMYIYINSCIQYSVCHVLKFIRMLMRACVRSFVRYFHQYSVLLLPKHTLPQPDQSNRHFFYSHSNADQKNWLVWI